MNCASFGSETGGEEGIKTTSAYARRDGFGGACQASFCDWNMAVSYFKSGLVKYTALQPKYFVGSTCMHPARAGQEMSYSDASAMFPDRQQILTLSLLEKAAVQKTLPWTPHQSRMFV